MRRKRILIALAVAAAVPLIVLAVAVLYLRFADLGAHRPRIERIVSDALGRDLRIAGELTIEVGRTTRVVAHDVTLANPEWAAEPAMIAIDRLEASIEPLALLSRIVRIPEVVVEGARLEFQFDDAGRSNWAFELPEREDAGPAGQPFEVEIGTADLRDVAVVFRKPGLSGPLDVDVSALGIVSDPAGELDITLDGVFDGTPIALSGRLGSFLELIRARTVRADLAGGVGDVELDLKVAFDDLKTFTGVEGTLGIHGPDLETATARFRLPRIGAGPFRIDAEVADSTAGTAIKLDASLDDLTAAVEGTLDTLLRPGDVDLTIRVAGPDLAAAGALAAVDRLPAEPFRAEGQFTWNGFPVRLDGVAIEVGRNRVAVDGVLGALPEALGTDLRLDASGPDVSTLAALAGIALPAQAFRVEARIERVDGGLRFDEVEARVGGAELSVVGTLGDPPERTATDLRVHVRVPDPSIYAGAVGQPLPALPFEFDVRLLPRPDAIVLEGGVARLGGNRVQVDGKIATVEGLVGSDLRVEATGPGLVWLETWIGEAAAAIPDGEYRLSGGVVVEPGSYVVRGVEVRLGDLEVALDGRIAIAERFAGSDVRFRASGPDLSILVPSTGVDDLPAEPFAISGSVKVGSDRSEVEDVEIQVGSWSVAAAGTVGHERDLSGTDLRLTAGGPLSELAPFVDRPLPDVPVTVSGTIGAAGGAYDIAGLEIGVGRHRLRVDGNVRPADDLDGTSLDLELSGPELRELGAWIVEAGFAEIPELPAEPFSIGAGVTVDADGYEIRKLDLSLGPAVAAIEGRLGRPPEFLETDLAVEADGPNASLFTALSGVTVPAAPFRVRGRVGRRPEGFVFQDFQVGVAEYRARAHGVLGDPPELHGTNIDVHADGPGLALIADLVDRDDLPDLPFVVDGHFEGDARRFKLERFSAQLGSSNLNGAFRLDLPGKPKLQGTFSSDRIDLVELFPPAESDPEGADSGSPLEATTVAAPTEDAAPVAGTAKTKISREPFDLGILQEYDADLSWLITEVVVPIGRYTDFGIDLHLEDGALHIGPVVATGRNGGRLTADLSTVPAAVGVALRTEFAIEGARLDMSAVDDEPTEWPSFDLAVVLDASGDSPHGLASTADGRILLVVGEGVVDSSFVDLIAADFVRTILEALSPFRRAHPANRLECAVIVGRLDDGVARFEPVAVQTDKLTVVGGGKIDFGPESLDLEWQVKPRKGIGVSASTLTNPYLKVGGTLARPRLEMKPVEAVTSTGVAVATGGLSILGRGLWDRITAERKVCARALEKADEEDRRIREAQEAAGAR